MLGLIVFQFVVAVMYGHHVFVKLQFLVYRGVVYPLALASVTVLTYNDGFVYMCVVCVAIVCTLVLVVMDVYVGGESYARQLIVDEGLPITFYMIVF